MYLTGAELINLRVPVDQLTRVRLQGAKFFRAGCHTATELEILYPVVVELFHTVMGFLEEKNSKMISQGLKFSSYSKSETPQTCTFPVPYITHIYHVYMLCICGRYGHYIYGTEEASINQCSCSFRWS